MIRVETEAVTVVKDSLERFQQYGASAMFNKAVRESNEEQSTHLQ